MKIEIKSRFSGSVLFAHEAEGNTLRVTLKAAVSADANLAGANLAGANLARANLARANLAGANLAGANLADANLAGANLAGADLADAKLRENLFLRGKRPIFTLGPIGSRCAQLMAYLTDQGVYIGTGCFFGTRVEFEAEVKKTHGENEHAKEYRVALAMIGCHEELWAEKDEQEKAA